MNATNATELMNTRGLQAKAASALMAKASAATKLVALRGLAVLLRATWKRRNWTTPKTWSVPAAMACANDGKGRSTPQKHRWIF